MIQYHDSSWLLQKRAEFVASHASSSSRVSAVAGRTGTRLNGLRPQRRWEEGVALAKETLSSRSKHMRGDAQLSIGTRIKNAFDTLRSQGAPGMVSV